MIWVEFGGHGERPPCGFVPCLPIVRLSVTPPAGFGAMKGIERPRSSVSNRRMIPARFAGCQPNHGLERAACFRPCGKSSTKKFRSFRSGRGRHGEFLCGSRARGSRECGTFRRGGGGGVFQLVGGES